jgi:hypothetical protein
MKRNECFEAGASNALNSVFYRWEVIERTDRGSSSPRPICCTSRRQAPGKPGSAGVDASPPAYELIQGLIRLVGGMLLGGRRSSRMPT